MSIQYNESNQIFLLQTDNSTYQMGIDSYGYLLHLYYGAHTTQLATAFLNLTDRGFS